MNVEPEKVLKKFNSRSGIKDAREKLKEAPELFDQLRKIKNRDIALKGQIEGEVNGNQLAQRFLDSNNYDILVELNGQEAVDSAIEADKILGSKEVTNENIKKLIKKGLAIKHLSYLGLIAL